MASIENVAKWAGVSLQQDGPLDQTVTDEHILEISGFLTDWESVAFRLRLAETRIKEIREVAIEQRTRELLTAWKSAYVRGATYRKLGEVLVKLARADFAEKVFKLVASMDSGMQDSSSHSDVPVQTDFGTTKPGNQLDVPEAISFDEILSDAFILKLMKNVTFDEAEKLAIYLRVKTQGFERTDPSLFAVNIVKWWKENCAKKPTEACRELASALKDAELASLSMKILNKLPQEEAGIHSTDDWKEPSAINDDAFILSLTKKITFDQAERLGIYLNVSPNHIDALNKIKDPNLFATKVVIKWRNNFTGSENEACEALSIALEKCNLKKESRAVSALVQGRAYVAGVEGEDVFDDIDKDSPFVSRGADPDDKKIWEVQAVGQIPLGSGSYGEVVKVTYKGKAYAAKKIKEHFVDTKDDYNKRSIKEYLILSKLSHPNIVRYCALGILPNIPLHVLVMELMKTDLHHHLLDTSIDISFEMKKGFLNDVAKGLKFLHSNKVWHRDLTAKNVLLDDRGTAKISDFGNSRVVNSDSGYTQSTLTSTPGLNVYMPPEACQRNPKYSHLIDIFSFGHLGLFVLVQEFPNELLPQTGQDAEGKLIGYSDVERREKYFAKIPPNHDTDQIVELVKKCLEYLPSKRPDIEDIIRKTN